MNVSPRPCFLLSPFPLTASSLAQFMGYGGALLLFVLGITATALWLAVALFHHSEPLVDLFRSEGAGRSNADAKCPSCGAPLVAGAKYCHTCGTAGT